LRSQDAGVSHSNDPEKSEGGAVGRGHPKRAKPSDMNPNEEVF